MNALKSVLELCSICDKEHGFDDHTRINRTFSQAEVDMSQASKSSDKVSQHFGSLDMTFMSLWSLRYILSVKHIDATIDAF